MPTDAQAVEPKLHSRPAQSEAIVEPPGPPANLLGFLSFLVFGSPRDLTDIYVSMAREYGDVVRMGAGPWRVYFVSHPDHVKYVLQDNNHNYGKQYAFNELLKQVIGNGLLTSEGEVWRRRRRLAQPAFHRRQIENFATTMVDETTIMLERWAILQRADKPFDVLVEMQDLATLIVGRALFSTDLSTGYTDTMRQNLRLTMEYLNRRMRRPLALPLWVPTPANRRLQKATRLSDEKVFDIIRERRKNLALNADGPNDLLGMLLAARDEETGEGLTDQELRDEITTFIGAGNETTAVTLAWAWYLLSKHPEVARKLHAELDAVLGGRAPSAADLPQLPYSRMIIEETMRLYPAAWAIGRGIVADDVIGRFKIQKGGMMIVSPYVTHRRPDIWDNPEGFEPERFTPERVAERPRYAYFPFGGGPRQCIGNTFALMEAQLVLATVGQKYRLHLIPGCTVEPGPIFTLRPNRPVMMTLQPR